MLKPFATVALLSLATLGLPIVIRHDRDDAAYQKLAATYKAPVCQIPGPGGHGTLVDKRWVVTAAHVVDTVPVFMRYVAFGDRQVPIKNIYLHPSWGLEEGRTDIALVELAEPVADIKPARLYDRQDEVGKEIVFVGSGMTGNGNTGPTASDGVWRAAHNLIARADSRVIAFEFEAPPKGSELEGISGPGDSGGPAFLRKGADLYVLGVSSDNSAPRGAGHCTYGTTETYGRVSTSLSWLREVMRGGAKPSKVSGSPQSFRDWPNTAVGRLAKEYLEALNACGPDAYVAFTNRYWHPTELVKVPADERRKMIERAQADFGRHRVVAIAESKNDIELLVQTERSGWMVLILYMDPRDSSKMMGMRRRKLAGPPQDLPK